MEDGLRLAEGRTILSACLQADFYISAFRGMSGTIEAYIDVHHDEITLEELISYMARIYYFYIDKEMLSKEIANTIERLKLIEIQEDYFELNIGLKADNLNS